MRTIAFLPYGAFGRAVAARLAADGRYRIDPLGENDASDHAEAVPDAVVSAGCVPLDTVRAAVGGGRGGRRPWLPILLEPSELSVGPWIGPRGTCVSCYTARRAQHDGSDGRSAVVRAVLEQSPGEDFWPFLPAHARIAAALAAQHLDRYFAADADAGSESGSVPDPRLVSRYRFGRSSIGGATVIPFGGCRDCREPGGDPGPRPLDAVFTLLAKEKVHANG